MIGRLRGILVAKVAPMLLIEVAGGIGYEVMMPINSSFYLLPQVGEQIIVYTHFIVRENEQALYGFGDEKQRLLFRNLIKVNGIGPKSALTILSGTDPDVLVQNIVDGEIGSLVKIPGIGAKTAQRLVMEMRDKIGELHAELSHLGGGSNAMQDAVSALLSLGYKPHQAEKAVAKHKDKNLSSEDLIRLALKEM